MGPAEGIGAAGAGGGANANEDTDAVTGTAGTPRNIPVPTTVPAAGPECLAAPPSCAGPAVAALIPVCWKTWDASAEKKVAAMDCEENCTFLPGLFTRRKICACRKRWCLISKSRVSYALVHWVLSEFIMQHTKGNGSGVKTALVPTMALGSGGGRGVLIVHFTYLVHMQISNEVKRIICPL